MICHSEMGSEFDGFGKFENQIWEFGDGIGWMRRYIPTIN